MKNIKDMTMGEMQAEIEACRKTCAPKGDRAVFVIDRGWIFAGDATTLPNGYVRLDRCVWVFRWESIGFSNMLTQWKDKKVDIRPNEPVEIPSNSIVFRIPVANDWGIK